jgi:hypothetical protein
MRHATVRQLALVPVALPRTQNETRSTHYTAQQILKFQHNSSLLMTYQAKSVFLENLDIASTKT